MSKLFISLLSISMLFMIACGSQNAKTTTEEVKQEQTGHEEWSKSANIYEVNIRQFTEEGTFKAFEQHMPRLKEMGVDILWIMPIHPISEVNRKGTLGSYYAVADYQKVNPEFGTKEDFRHMVNYAHELGFKVLIDWVANHTGWDNWMIEKHPEWYTMDSTGNIIAPVADWTDVADLNYNNADMREYMIQSLEYWVKEFNIDGYRCDVAGMVPTEFWVAARNRLDAIKPVFMLAEHESPEIHAAFDMTYGWEFHHILNKVAQGEKTTEAITEYHHKIDSLYQDNDYIMNFTSNHDENSWNGTVSERMGDLGDAMFVIAATVPGMPLIYTGQEDALNKRLEFFEKDAIEWKDYSKAPFFKKLLELKKNNKALWNGKNGGSWEPITDGIPEGIYAYARIKDNNTVLVFVNLTNEQKSISLSSSKFAGNYLYLFTDNEITIPHNSEIAIDGGGYLVLEK